MEPLIIEAALSAIAEKARNPNVPILPNQIAEDGRRCIKAGAAIIHNHIDNFALHGAAARYLEGWKPILATYPDTIFYGTGVILSETNATAGAIEDRQAHTEILGRSGVMRMAYVEPGSVNLFKNMTFVNSDRDISYQLGQMARLGLGPAIGIFEPSFLRETINLYRRDRIPPGALVKLNFVGKKNFIDADYPPAYGLPATVKALEIYLEMLEGCDLPWSVLVSGGDVVESGLARAAIAGGGHVRVGLEDYGGARQPSNAELVSEVVKLASELGRRVADSATAAAILNLPEGTHNSRFSGVATSVG